MAKTSIDYCKAVKQKYEEEKSKKYEGFLIEPTPAGLRELCLIFFEKGLNKKDEEVFANFFKPIDENGLKRAIENVDVEKFKPVCNFLKGISKSTNNTILNLLAIIVELECRPFSKFIHNGEVKDDSVIEHNEKVSNSVENKKNLKTGFKKKVGIGILGLLGLFTIGYTAKDIIMPEKQCMVWQKDHYAAVDCNDRNSANSLGEFSEVKSLNEEFGLKRIIPNSETQFFKNGKPQVWYCKINNDSIEFFSNHGFHPENGKPLRPVTNYILKKYLIYE
jgi:hypothetical protein